MYVYYDEELEKLSKQEKELVEELLDELDKVDEYPENYDEIEKLTKTIKERYKKELKNRGITKKTSITTIGYIIYSFFVDYWEEYMEDCFWCSELGQSIMEYAFERD